MNLYSANALADCRRKKTRYLAIAVAVTVCRCAAWRVPGRVHPLFSSLVRVVFFSSVLVYVLLFVLYLFLVFISSILYCAILVYVYIGF